MEREDYVKAIHLMYAAFIASPEADIPEQRILVHEVAQCLLSQIEPYDFSSHYN